MIKGMVFIDGTWLYHGKDFISGGQTKFSIDYGKLPKVVAAEAARELGFGSLDIARVHLFGSYPVNCAEDEEDFAHRQKDFLTMLKARYRYELRVFPVDYKGRCLRKEDRDPEDHFEPKERCVDIALASSLLYHAAIHSYDVAIVVLGNRDFLPVLEDVRRLGKRIVIASIRGCCANELYESDDDIPVIRDAPVVWLDEIADKMELKLVTNRVKCDSPIHEGDPWVATTYQPKDGEPFYCDDCRHEYGEMMKMKGPRFDVSVGEQLQGMVKTVVASRGYGFIIGEDGRDYFFHVSQLAGVELDELRMGETVSFVVKELGQGERAGKVSDVSLVAD